MDDRSDQTGDNVPDGILAAGGIVLGGGSHGGKIALVERARYSGEIGLPKGKVKPGEILEVAAVREVGEETGLPASILGYGGSTHYVVNREPKAVFYFVMSAEGEAKPKDTGEIRGVRWMSPAEAVGALTHIEDRDLVSAVFGVKSGGG